MNKNLKAIFVGVLLASSLLAGCKVGSVKDHEKLLFTLGYRKAHIDVLKFYLKHKDVPGLEDMDVDKAWREVQESMKTLTNI